jgi:hypothetical protein
LESDGNSLSDLVRTATVDILGLDFLGLELRKLIEINAIRDIIEASGVVPCTDCEMMARWSAFNYTVC